MHRRPPALTPRALAVALIVLLGSAGRAPAHALVAAATVSPDGKVSVESWFDPGATVARGARVEVFNQRGQLLHLGRTDNEGAFVFSIARAEPLRVVVSAGAGHRAEIRIAADKLPRGLQPSGADASTAAPPSPSVSVASSPVDRSSRIAVKDVLVGVGFLLAAGAFALSLRNARQLRELRARMRSDQPRPEE